MQPYFFPYIGYYQLVYESELFIFLDDVNFIKKGYIHRNSIISNGNKLDFTIPVKHVSQNRKINEHEYVGNYSDFLLKIQKSYKNSPQFKIAMPLIESIVLDQESNVSLKNAKSICEVFRYLALERRFYFSSKVAKDSTLRSQDKIIGICNSTGIDNYRNAIGGKELYKEIDFHNHGIELKFISPRFKSYPQNGSKFIPGMSMIDVLMNNDIGEIRSLILEYDLV